MMAVIITATNITAGPFRLVSIVCKKVHNITDVRNMHKMQYRQGETVMKKSDNGSLKQTLGKSGNLAFIYIPVQGLISTANLLEIKERPSLHKLCLSP